MMNRAATWEHYNIATVPARTRLTYRCFTLIDQLSANPPDVGLVSTSFPSPQGESE